MTTFLSSRLRPLLPVLALLFFTLPALAQRTEGMASYYADRFHLASTSTGEQYDKHALTAASKEFDYGTVLEVTHVASGKKVTVRVNDCGPHHPDRIIDLSRAAAREIGLLRAGSAMVRLRVIEAGTQGPTCERSAWAQREAAREAQPTAPPPTVQVKGPDAPRRRRFAPDEMLFGVQVGAFSKESNAKALVETLTELGFGEVWSTKTGLIHRVYTGKYYFQDEAQELRNRVREAGYRDATVRRVQ
ncbi:septal ring lytic transglycosylase RlpA family protein [Lewinella sp. JB7]|uniref:septal ring lytic transglycosylase RlpA family protein n=1 Tax=Lewinella sp. JB7 TaxID=2962887 RepID=UPI0020CA1FCB|nr:septal ring lytic transglycosylase RlpA family protein [Lewinella sp. JB7]MCP9237040.1 septal ring lytic transglycosylase RlpA family protein [Lewinella sp. JB7]